MMGKRIRRRPRNIAGSGGSRSGGGLAASVFCVCFLIAFIFSAVLILIHADHDHDHDGEGGCCSVCAQIAAARNMLRQFGAAAQWAALALGGLCAVACPPARAPWIGVTLTALKVRMNS